MDTANRITDIDFTVGTTVVCNNNNCPNKCTQNYYGSKIELPVWGLHCNKCENRTLNGQYFLPFDDERILTYYADEETKFKKFD